MSVNERATGSLVECGLGSGYRPGLLAFGVAQDNLFGTGKSISARVSREAERRITPHCRLPIRISLLKVSA